jgi:hypothetical protein
MGVRVAFLEERGPAAAGGGSPPPRGVLVPVSAIRQDGATDLVFVMRDGRAERRAVTLGGLSGDSRQVQAGVVAGDPVIVDPPAELIDGDAVSVRE